MTRRPGEAGRHHRTRERAPTPADPASDPPGQAQAPGQNDAPSPSPIIDLMEMLRGDEPVAWDAAEACLVGFPGWATYVQRLRYPSLTSNNRLVHVGDPAQYSYLGTSQIRTLARLFGPFAVLLDTRRTPFERAHMLRKLGVDPIQFATEGRHNASAAISLAAQEMLAAANSEGGLLRPAAFKSQEMELLRPVSPTGDAGADADLLHPVDGSVEPVRTTWWQRLAARLGRPHERDAPQRDASSQEEKSR
jgi:hypothetical protein